MTNLTLLEEEILEMLKKIEYCCESAELRDSNTFKNRKSIEIFYTDKGRPPLERELLQMNNIEKYLQKNDIDFHVTHNFIDEPDRDDGFIMLGIINTKDVRKTKAKIANLKNKILKLDNNKTKPFKIILNTNENCLMINSVSVPIPKESIERSMIEILVDSGEEVSWDEIYEKNEPESNTGDNEKKKVVSDTKRRLNKKIIKESDLKEELIKQRRNTYSLTKKVIKK